MPREALPMLLLGYADFACQIDPIAVQVVYRDEVTAAPA
jgi:hypothetical protein